MLGFFCLDRSTVEELADDQAVQTSLSSFPDSLPNANDKDNFSQSRNYIVMKELTEHGIKDVTEGVYPTTVTTLTT